VFCVLLHYRETVVDAKKYAYKAIENITYEGMFFRNDIGHRAVTREN
jgi:Phosphoribosylamine-glycine ligase